MPCCQDGAGAAAFLDDLLLLEQLEEQDVPGRGRHDHQDDEDRPECLGPTAQVVAPEDIREHKDQQPDPDDEEEELQHREEEIEDRILVGGGEHVDSFIAVGLSWSTARKNGPGGMPHIALGAVANAYCGAYW